MAQAVSTSITRRGVIAGLAVTAAATVFWRGRITPTRRILRKVSTNVWGASSPSQRWWITSATP